MMRVRPTFDSVTMGISAGLVKQRNFPALDIVRSPQYNLFYEAAAGNPMHEQAQRMHNAQLAEVELKQAASATGVSHHELKAEMQQMRQVQTNQEMAMAHFDKMDESTAIMKVAPTKMGIQ